MTIRLFALIILVLCEIGLVIILVALQRSLKRLGKIQNELKDMQRRRL